MLAAFPTKGNSMRLFGWRIALWLTLLAVGESGIGFAVAACCLRPGAGFSCCVSSSTKHSPAGMRSMDCHDSADNETAEVSSAPCNMASSAISLEFAEEGWLAGYKNPAVDSGLSFVSSMSGEGDFVPRTRSGISIGLATRQRLPVEPPVPLRI
jgi:hypothetical protein